MKEKKELKVLRKRSTEYLMKMYSKGVSFLFDKSTWKSTDSDGVEKIRLLLKSRKSLKKIGKELKIFKFPTIVGVKIIYYNSMSLFFDKFEPEHQKEMIAEGNYLLRDISTSSSFGNENELKIFKWLTVDHLEKQYLKSRSK